jgi:hypothetical protein
MPDDPVVRVTPRFQELFDGLPDDHHRDEVLGTLQAIERQWCALTHRHRSIHSYDWEDVVNPPLRMLLCLGVKSGRPHVLAVDIFAIRSSDDLTPQERLETAQLWCLSEQL